MPNAVAPLWKMYLQPKKVETIGNKTIYDYIGIRLYKRYLPTTGDIARRRKGIRQLDLSNGDRIKQLYRYEKKTRIYELRHIIGAIAFVAITLCLKRKLTLFDYLFLPALNLYINIYPIFLQRYNRIRILRVLKSMGCDSPF